MGVWALDVAVAADAAEALLVQIDMLLDRAAERALQTPRAGTESWRAEWSSRESAAGQDRAERHRSARAAIARAAGLPVPGDRADASRSRAPRRRQQRSMRTHENQLTLFASMSESDDGDMPRSFRPLP